MREIDIKYAEYEELKEKYVYLKEEINSVLKQIAELEVVRKTLENLRQFPDDREQMINIGGGIFAKVKILDKENFMVNVGGNIYIEKNVEEILQILDNQEKSLNDLLKNLERELEDTIVKIRKIRKELRDLLESEGTVEN